MASTATTCILPPSPSLRLCVCTSVVSARVCKGLGGPSRVQLTSIIPIHLSPTPAAPRRGQHAPRASHVEMKSTCTLTCTASTVALPLALEDIPSSEHHIVVAYAIAHRIPTPNNKCRQNERAPRVPRAGLVRGAAGGGRNARRLRRQTSTETSTETPRGDSAGNKSQGVVPGAFRLTLLGRSPAPPTDPPPAPRPRDERD